MKHITQKTKELQDAIFEILKRWDAKDRGWWHGYIDLTNLLLEDYNIYVESIALLKKALQNLKTEGKVITQPIFKESDGMLNGTGWFFNYYELKNDKVKRHFPGL